MVYVEVVAGGSSPSSKGFVRLMLCVERKHPLGDGFTAAICDSVSEVVSDFTESLHRHTGPRLR